MAPDGQTLVTGNAKGKMQQYEIAVASSSGSDEAGSDAGILAGSRRELACQGSGHSAALDCIVRRGGGWGGGGPRRAALD